MAICICLYTTIRQYVLTDINLYAIPAVLYFPLCLGFHFVSGFDHSLSVS